MASNSTTANLRFSDDPMFKRVMEREDICKDVIERILGRTIGEVTYHNTEQERRIGTTGKVIRMDSYLVESDGDVFDVEMQMSCNPVLPRRFRGYQSVLDGSFLKRGEDYSELRESYIIFICVEDPFRAGLPVYDFERSCVQQSEVRFDCGSHWTALNASAYSALGEDSKLGSLLEYIYANKVDCDDDLVQRIDAEVARNNDDREWLMTMIDSITIAEQEARIRGRMQGRAEGREEGREEGRAEGREQGRAEGRKEGIEQGRKEGLAEGEEKAERRYARLMATLFEQNRIDDARQANLDPETRKALYQELGI